MADEKSTFLGRRELLGALTAAATGGLSVAAEAMGDKTTESTAALNIKICAFRPMEVTFSTPTAIPS